MSRQVNQSKSNWIRLATRTKSRIDFDDQALDKFLEEIRHQKKVKKKAESAQLNPESDFVNPETQSEKSEPQIVGLEPSLSLPEPVFDIPEPIDPNRSSSSDTFEDAIGDTAELINVLKQVAKSGTNIKIDAFKGTSDINTWFQAFEATTVGRDDPDKLRLLTSALKEDALTWFGLEQS